MKNNFKKIISLLLLAMFISSCAPSDVDLVVYTTDVDAVLDGDIVEVPIKASFTLYSDDEDGDLDRATAIAEKYLSKDSIFS